MFTEVGSFEISWKCLDLEIYIILKPLSNCFLFLFRFKLSFYSQENFNESNKFMDRLVSQEKA